MMKYNGSFLDTSKCPASTWATFSFSPWRQALKPSRSGRYRDPLLPSNGRTKRALMSLAKNWILDIYRSSWTSKH